MFWASSYSLLKVLSKMLLVYTIQITFFELFLPNTSIKLFIFLFWTIFAPFAFFLQVFIGIVFQIKSTRNEHFWKFWPFYFKHCTKCQIFMAKKEKYDAKKWIYFKIEEELWYLIIAFWSESKKCGSYAVLILWLNMWLILPLKLWRLPTIKPFKLLS